MTSPYKGKKIKQWSAITKKIVKEHPLSTKGIVDIVLSSWSSIFASGIGSKRFKIGKDIFPKPQIMGFFLHELIPLELAARYPKLWRPEKTSEDKDIVYIPDDQYSIEIKTSSSSKRIFGNRSYAHGSKKGKKAKSGYYLAINFEKVEDNVERFQIKLIRFGWIDESDWIGQKAASGQQSRLSPEVETYKFIELYTKS